MKKLPPDIEWCDVPSGTIQRGALKGLHCDVFKISKYPITNAQYGRFVSAGGYQNRRYKNSDVWTNAGWKFLESGEYIWGRRPNSTNEEQWSKDIQQFKVWRDNEEFPIRQAGNFTRQPTQRPTHPVVFVSWFEALAFVRWTNLEYTPEQLKLPNAPDGRRWLVRLPTEAEWQWAATDCDTLDFPWGSTVDTSKWCNSVEFGLHDTAPSMFFLYTKGGRPSCGAECMMGNVWEWCNSRWADYGDERYTSDSLELSKELDVDHYLELQEGFHDRVHRGNSRFDPVAGFSGFKRNGIRPIIRYNNCGFRVVASLKP